MRNWVAALLLALLAPTAAGEIWECVDESGKKHFTNIKSEAKGCRLLDIGPPNTVPGVKPQPKAVPARGPSPGVFPKVDPQTQKQRDADRRRILEQELASEEKLLARAKKELAGQEAIRLGSERNYQRVLDRLEPYKKQVRLHEDNVASLKRELANAR